MLSLHTFSTPLLCILNLSAWNYKGHLHSEKLFQFHRIRFKKIYIQSQTPDTEFFEAETRKKKQPSFPLWIFLQDNHLAPTLHLYSALPGQVIPRGVKLPDQPARFGSLSLFACCWEKRDLDLLTTAASKEAWAHQALAASWHVRSWQYRQKTLCSMNDLRPLSQPKNQLFAHHLYKNHQLKLCFA